MGKELLLLLPTCYRKTQKEILKSYGYEAVTTVTTVTSDFYIYIYCFFIRGGGGYCLQGGEDVIISPVFLTWKNWEKSPSV